MSLRNISTQEAQRISRICERVHCCSSDEPFNNHLYVVLNEALPGIHFTIDHFTFSPLTLHQPINKTLPDITFTMFEHFMHQHPGLQQYASDGFSVGSLLTALDPHDYQQTELYNEVYRPVDINDQVWMGIGNNSELIAASYSRDTAYTQLEHLTLTLLQPQIQIAWNHWRHTRDLETQLQQLKESQIQSDEQACKAAAMKRRRDALSPRRREIVELIAAGKTNPQIAAELHISRRTVEKHIEHIFAAVGINSRATLRHKTGLPASGTGCAQM